MSVIDCEALARVARWNVARCCRSCHSEAGSRCDDDSFDVDLGDGVTLSLCCRSGTELCLTGVDFAMLRESTTSADAR